MDKKVLYISTIYPYPKDNGKKIILSSMIEYHLMKYGKDNVHFAIVGNTEEINDSRFHIINISKPKALSQILSIFKHSFILRCKSIQESVLYNKVIKQRLEEVVLENNYELIIIDTIRIAQFFDYSNKAIKNMIVYMDDLFSIRYEKMLEALENNPTINLNPLGNFKKLIPNSFSRLIKFKALTKFLLKVEKKLVRKSEINITRRYKKCLLISNDEVNYMNEKYGISNIQSIKPLLQENKYNRNFLTDSRDFIFLGNLSIAHNNVSIINFIEKNIKNLINHRINLRIIGKNPSEELMQLENKYNNIKIIGFVEDLKEEFNNACGMVVPLVFGTGVKLKTLEAFSYGLPVITTDFGIEGINIKNEDDQRKFILENDIEEYWRHMLELCDVTINKEISKACYDFFNSEYSKKEVYKQYDKLFSN